jgi:hypothetical protein
LAVEAVVSELASATSIAGKYREIPRFQSEDDDDPPCSQWKFNGLLADFLGGKTGEIFGLSGNEI